MPVLVPWEPVWAGTGGSSQPQPVCSQLMDPHISNGWELPAGNGGIPPKKSWGGLSIPTTQHPVICESSRVGLSFQRGILRFGEPCAGVGWRQELGMSQSEFTRALSWLLRHRRVPELAGAWSKEWQ